MLLVLVVLIRHFSPSSLIGATVGGWSGWTGFFLAPSAPGGFFTGLFFFTPRGAEDEASWYLLGIALALSLTTRDFFPPAPRRWGLVLLPPSSLSFFFSSLAAGFLTGERDCLRGDEATAKLFSCCVALVFSVKNDFSDIFFALDFSWSSSWILVEALDSSPFSFPFDGREKEGRDSGNPGLEEE